MDDSPTYVSPMMEIINCIYDGIEFVVCIYFYIDNGHNISIDTQVPPPPSPPPPSATLLL